MILLINKNIKREYEDSSGLCNRSSSLYKLNINDKNL